MMFPRYVFRLPGDYKAPGLPPHERALCADAAAHAKAKAAGWHDTIGEAIAAHDAKKAPPAKQSAPAKPEAKQPDLAPVGEKA